MLTPCKPGKLSTLTFDNPDCPTCRSISQITQSADGLSVTFYYTDGTSQIFTLPRGLTGATGAAGATGSAGSSGTSILANQYPNLSTLGVAYESLLDGKTPYVLSANTLNTNLDEIQIHSVFTTSSWTTASQRCRLTFNGNAINIAINIAFYASNVNKITIDVRLSRITNGTAKYEMVAKYYTVGLGGSTLIQEYNQDIETLGGLDFTNNAYNIDAQGDSVVAGDVTCGAFEITYKHKS